MKKEIVFEELSKFFNKDIGEIKLEKIYNEGINNEVYMIESGSKRYALKLYKKQNKDDKRDRQNAETKFLTHAYNRGLRNIPKIVVQSRQNNWCLMTWQEGNKPKTINNHLIDEMCNFVESLNAIPGTEEKGGQNILLGNASEYCHSLDNECKKTMEKLTKARNICERNNNEKLIDACKNLSKQLEKEISRLNIKNRRVKHHWRNIHTQQIVSPSDIGIHNIIENKNDYSFIDFEYAGLDDLSKLCADITKQPNHQLKKSSECRVINKLVTIQENEDWIERYKDIKGLVTINWCSIVIRAIVQKERTDNYKQKGYKFLESMEAF